MVLDGCGVKDNFVLFDEIGEIFLGQWERASKKRETDDVGEGVKY